MSRTRGVDSDRQTHVSVQRHDAYCILDLLQCHLVLRVLRVL